MKKLIFLLLIILLPVASFGATEITWYGHSSFKIQTPNGKVLLIDPWLTNPANKEGKRHLKELPKVDLILLTHAHGDHIGNSIEIAKETGAKLVATYDLGKAIVKYAGYPEKQFGYETTGNFGGEITLLNGEVKILFVPAVHSSALEIPDSPKSLIYGGNPGGFLISIKNGPTLYHTGDTDLFEDMKLLGLMYKVDIMMVCIGDKFTMGPKRAAIATKFVNPKMVIPMHFGTFPMLNGTVEEFENEIAEQKIQTKILKIKIGETVKIE
ncbi:MULTISPECIES: metal-dependent hydrolase [Thermodesulfovibrio]|uniref:metal-dependent hydrolase n=1 Tax=Thermodesulfovibrio TaxID=28261 RepID=UPI001141DE5F|nr:MULTISPECIES: metal-dependent hydrolase [Thermodesulfovibrio]MBC7190015.1 metal-dependent hydrolase [Candidatus Aerophobetes bacterium]MDI6864647.1 metal-dependent hydrolase [Thermodesulfovibrio yellowstonii]